MLARELELDGKVSLVHPPFIPHGAKMRYLVGLVVGVLEIGSIFSPLFLTCLLIARQCNILAFS
jgi:hypothetical protein